MERRGLWDWMGGGLVRLDFRENLVAAIGGGLAILVLSLLTGMVLHRTGSAAVVASMGATAVLVFCIPHGPLAQPWAVIGGHAISAFAGVCCARWLPSPAAAAGVAVFLAIGGMLLLGCLHPPGGGTALVAVIGGPSIQAMGFGFVLIPVAVNAVAMVLLAILVNGFFAWRRYPAALHRRYAPQSAVPAPPAALRPTHDEVVAALRSMETFVDISEDELVELAARLCHPAAGGAGEKQTSCDPPH